MIKKFLALFRNVAFLAALCLFLLTTTLGAITWGVQTAAILTAGTTVAVNRAVKATLAQARVRQAKAVMKTKAKARIRRAVVAMTAEVLEEVLQELPEYVRPKPETVFKLIPKCESEETPQH